MSIHKIAWMLAVVAACGGAQAQVGDYPNRSVHIVVPYATGGGSDILARQLGASLQQMWKQPVVVENKPGASGNIGSREVVRAPADGYPLLLQNSTMVTNLGVSGKLPYDPEKDLKPILLLGITPIGLAAHPSSNISDLKSLVEASMAQGGLSYGSCGIGTPQHFAMEMVKFKTGIEAVHAGYKGCSPAVADALGGQIPLAIVSANLLTPYLKSGRLKVVGISSAQRYEAMPDVPTFEEQGLKPLDMSIWHALMGPASLPQSIVDRVAEDARKVMEDPAVRANLSKAGVEPFVKDAAALGKLIREDAVRYIKLAKSARISAE